jgi:chitin disaccharide deacetylase
VSSLSQFTTIRKSNDAAVTAPSHDGTALVIVNADDWGRDSATTDRTLACYQAGSISSVSAMVFMANSQSAAELAREHGIDSGLHLNFTAPYTARNLSSREVEHQQEIARMLTRHRFASAIYNPRLTASFDYVVKAQIDEYERLYGTAPKRLDGHHHMHLCANMMCQELLPKGTIVRRNLSFAPGEKHLVNRLYRCMQDRRLAQRHRMADYFFDLNPTEQPDRLHKILQLGSNFNVEIETHPINDNEYEFLMNGALLNCAGKTKVASRYLLRSRAQIRARESVA